MKALPERTWLLVSLFTASRLSAAIALSLQPSATSPVALGTAVTWTATASAAGAGTLWYRFRVAGPGGTFRTVVDYGPNAALTWTTIEREGTYTMEASVFNTDTLEEAVAQTSLTFSPLVSGTAPVITPSANPLVFIYSAPPCPAGESMRVQFRDSNSRVQWTPEKSCAAGISMNFYLAGLQPGLQYSVQHVLGAGRILSAGPVLTFFNSVLAVDPLTFTALVGDPPQGMLLQSLLGSPAQATDLSGNLVWQGPADVTYLTQPVAGGTFMGLGQNPLADPSQQFVREFDLAGITVAETNAARINQQLVALGMHPVNGFHHEAAKLSNGGYLVLADSERILTNVQGPGPVDVIGDTILVLGPDLQLTWAWDAFDHLDNSRMATLGETCTYPPGLTCAPFYLATTANDWLHGNALQLLPDGNILYSARHQDWLIKIDYANGAGAGDVLWRMGVDGDFQITSSDPYPWFSHQHGSNFKLDNTTLLVFDNGNVRAATNPNAHSRGQVLHVDESNRVVTPVLNADLGLYSEALGTAEQLPDGNYHFDAGFLLNGAATDAESMELDASGRLDFAVEFGALEYRSFRMPDLYTTPAAALQELETSSRISSR